MQYKHYELKADLDTLGVAFDLGIETSDQVYMSCNPTYVGLKYYHTLDNAAGCGYINVPFDYDECEQIKTIRIAASENYNGTYLLNMYVNQKDKLFRVTIGSNNGSETTVVDNGDPFIGDCETHTLYLDWPSGDNRTGAVIGYKDRSFALKMRTGTEVYLETVEYTGPTYSTNLSSTNYLPVDYAFYTENAEVMMQQLASEIDMANVRITQLESKVSSLDGLVTNTYVSR